MRVVAGSAAGRRLEAPPGSGTRPTGDRVREATFNSLGSLGLVQDATMVDLFAGSGALGIEALSRGASEVTFVERDARAVRVVRANLNTVGLTEPAEVVRAEALAFLESTTRTWDVALLDPPYVGRVGSAVGGFDHRVGGCGTRRGDRGPQGVDASAGPPLRRYLGVGALPRCSVKHRL